MGHDLPVPGHQRFSLANLLCPRRHRILVILRGHPPVEREPQPATTLVRYRTVLGALGPGQQPVPVKSLADCQSGKPCRHDDEPSSSPEPRHLHYRKPHLSRKHHPKHGIPQLSPPGRAPSERPRTGPSGGPSRQQE